MNQNLSLQLLITENICFFLTLIFFVFKRKNKKTKENRILNSIYTPNINNKAKFKNFSTENCHFNFKTIFELPSVGLYQFKLIKINVHKHPNVSSLLYIINGEAFGYIGKKEVHAKPGDFIYVPRNTPHHWEMKKPVEYLEISTPSLTATHMNDIIWL